MCRQFDSASRHHIYQNFFISFIKNRLTLGITSWTIAWTISWKGVFVFSRTNRNIINQWFLSIDRKILFIFLSISMIGIVLNFAATPPLAKRLGLAPFYFAQRHIFYMIPTLLLMAIGSILNPIQIRKLCLILMIVSLGLLVATPFIGYEIKGAKRWIQIMGISVQISELIKPCFAVMSAWLITKQFHQKAFKGILFSFALLLFILFFLLMQPDLGMSIVLIATWLVQIFLGGMPLFLALVIAFFVPVFFFLAYLLFPHVAYRFQVFLSGEQSYQVSKAIEAVRKGGFFGRGIGEGVIKKYVPDAHADFIFAVAGEEFGIVLCLLIIALFVMLLYFVGKKLKHNKSYFSILTIAGIMTQFVIQSLINMSSVLGVIPTKGMTLPLISYGGSSLIALGLSCSIILSLTKKYQDCIVKF